MKWRKKNRHQFKGILYIGTEVVSLNAKFCHVVAVVEDARPWWHGGYREATIMVWSMVSMTEGMGDNRCDGGCQPDSDGLRLSGCLAEAVGVRCWQWWFKLKSSRQWRVVMT
jgi:hypothetical protein